MPKLVAFEAEKISKELLVAAEIQKMQDRGEVCYFRELVRRLAPLAGRSTIARSLDILTDQGMLCEGRGTLPDGTQVTALTISHHSTKFARCIIQAIELGSALR